MSHRLHALFYERLSSLESRDCTRDILMLVGAAGVCGGWCVGDRETNYIVSCGKCVSHYILYCTIFVTCKLTRLEAKGILYSEVTFVMQGVCFTNLRHNILESGFIDGKFLGLFQKFLSILITLSAVE